MEVIAIELTEEELAEVIHKREEAQKRETAYILLGEIKERLDALQQLGYCVRGREVGGGYTRRHEPLMSTSAIHLTRW